MINFAREDFTDIVDDIKPTLPLNYNELATYKDIPLDPNYPMYEQAAKLDLIRFYTARVGGELVGYAVVMILPRHAHYDHPWATSNLFWIHPAYRRSGAGRGLLSFVKKNLVGFVLQILSSVDHPDLGELLDSEGFSRVEIVHSLRL